VLVWDFADLITPVLKLEAPQEVFCFRFNPTQPDLVIAGTLSGQVR
jgi:dynein intermediate chain 3, axonemal